jgi:hypothetical protein
MATFKDVVGSSERAFGMNLKQAWKMQKMKSLKEGMMKIRDKAMGINSGKYYVIPKDYQKVQWRAFISGNVVASSFYWTTMATIRYCMSAYDLLKKHPDFNALSSNLAIASVFMGLAVAAHCYQSRKLVKELRKQQE